MPESLNKRLVVKNSALLYVRMLFTMWINLYATRLTLQNLGVEDMGVYGVVGSIVSLTGVLASGNDQCGAAFSDFRVGTQGRRTECCVLYVTQFRFSIECFDASRIGSRWVGDALP